MRTKLKSLSLAVGLSIASMTAGNALAAPLVNLEGPAKNEVTTGIIVLYGWAIDVVKIDSVHVSIDNSRRVDVDNVLELAYGADRSDVARVFPEVDGWENPQKSGFSAAFGTANLKNGRHKIEIIVTNVNGEETVVTSHFIVTNPPGRNGPRDKIDISEAVIRIEGQTIIMDNVIINGVPSNGIIFEFDPTSNSFRLTGAEGDKDFDGIDDEFDDDDDDEFEDEDDDEEETEPETEVDNV